MPLGTRTAVGVVWSAREGDGGNLKSVIEVKPWPRLSEPLRDFIDWIARWTLTPRGAVLRMAARTPERLEPPAPRVGLHASGRPPGQAHPRSRPRPGGAGRRHDAPKPNSRPKLASPLACSTASSRRARSKPCAPARARRPAAQSRPPPAGAGAGSGRSRPRSGGGRHRPRLRPVPARRRHRLRQDGGLFRSRRRRPARRPSNPGADAGNRSDGPVPRPFRRPFRRAPPPNGIPASRRAAASACGPPSPAARPRSSPARARRCSCRSAISASIVVDEEHEGAYKQEDGVLYNARDMAVVRARLEKAPIVLASATPSIETRVNAEQGRYRWLRLKQRFRARALPDIAAIDLRRAGPPRGRFLAPKLVAEVETTLAAGEQALLFLNRRGYAPLTLCRACGHRFQCPNCSAWLVEHRFRKALVCHHCGHFEPKPTVCPKCDEPDSLTPCGPGVERVAEEAEQPLPRRAPLDPVLRHDGRGREVARGIGRRHARRLRPHHRHPTRRQGPRFSRPHAGRHCRRRRGTGEWRPARRRAHVPASASGDRTRGTRRKARTRLSADLPARAPCHRGAAVRRCRALLRDGDRAAPARPACRRLAGSRL